MLPNDLAVSVTDVFTYHQKKGKVFIPARGFSAISLRLNTGGKYLCRGKSISFEPGSICIIPEGVGYERNNNEEDIHVIHFRMLNYAMEEINVFKLSHIEEYEKLFFKALKIKEENTIDSNYRITAVLYEIFAHLINDTGFADNPKDKRIIESAEYMRQNFSNPSLSVELLADKVNLSSVYYRREFNRVYGASPKEYLNTLRIQYAKSLLETGYFSHKEVADRCGFSDVGYFRTAFKNRVGKSIKSYLADFTENER